MDSLKRKAEMSGNSPKKVKKESCPHNERCYRRNIHHFKEYDHPHLIKFIEMGDSLEIPDGMPQPKQVYLEQIDILKPLLTTSNVNKTSNSSTSFIKEVPLACGASTSAERKSNKGKTTVFNSSEKVKSSGAKAKPGTMLKKFEETRPYNIFFTTIPESPETLNKSNTIEFTDLLCPSLGELKRSLQINFMIDIDWLLKQYKARNLHQKPLTIIYGDDWPDMIEFMNRFCPNVTYKFFKMKDPFGCHHSKIGIYLYEDNSLRVVVSTANLYFEDWNHYNQGVWLSPACPKLPENSSVNDGESPTGFKADLLKYLKSYNTPALKDWIEYVSQADFSAVKVFFIYSGPGKYYPKSNGCHLHKVAELLSKYCSLPAKTTPTSEGPLAWGVFAQASSIGSMGKHAGEWLRSCVLRSLASHKHSPLPSNSSATLNIVYPSVENVAHGFWGLQSGGCLPYSKATNEKQKWLQSYMHQWKADELKRTRAMPHIKSYCRVSPCLSKLAYFLLTSANLSKSAWGGNINKDGGVYVRSYECGVLFLPQFFGEEYFEIKKSVNSKNETVFPFMYDLPLTPYKPDDYPWCN